MQAVSEVLAYDLFEGDDRLISYDPQIITGFVICETSGSATASVVICGAHEEGPYFWLGVGPSQSLAFPCRIAAPYGLMIKIPSGDARVNLAYE